MKNLKLFGLAMLVLGVTACQEGVDPQEDPILDPIKKVTAMDGNKEVSATVDHFAKTIKFEAFQYLTDLSAVSVKIEVAEGATLVSPAEVVTVDLNKEFEVVVNNKVLDLTYTMSAAKADLTPIRAAGFALVDTYDPLPEYIKVYKNDKLGANKEETGFLIEVKKGATFSLVGNGSEASATFVNQVAKEKNDWVVYVNGICGMKSCSVLDGQLNYSSSGSFAAFAVLKDGKFEISCQKRVEKADKTKTIAKLNEKGEIINEDWLKDINIAMGGTALMVANGKKLSPEDQKVTDGGYSYGWWKGNAGHAREAIGVNKEGTAAYIFVCDKSKGGLSMQEVQDVMFSINSYNVMFTEGSSSANALIKGQKTVAFNEGVKPASNILLIK